MIKLKKVLGISMIASVFIALFCYLAIDSDFITAVKVYAVVIFVVGLIFGGVFLSTSE